MRSSTSVSHTKGSTPLSFAVATRLATIAQWRAPPSDPANKADGMTVLGRARGRRPRSAVLTGIVPSDGAIREPRRMGMSHTNAFIGLDVHKEDRKSVV